MPVKNVECQVAEMQIGRYVSGDILSGEALKQLEAHVAGCPSCNRILSDRRKALNSMLTYGFAAVSTDVPSANKENLLIKALKEKAEVGTPKKAPRPTAHQASPEPPKKNDFSSKMAALMGGAPKSTSTTNKNLQKPLLYSAALAVVLLAMGYISRGQGSFLGDNADSAFPPAATTSKIRAKSASAVKPSEKTSRATSGKVSSGDPSPSRETANKTISIGTVSTPGESAAKPNSEPSDSSSKNDANEPQLSLHSSRPHKRHRMIAAQERSHHPRHDQHAKAHHSANKVHVYKPSSIKIYDESGNPLRS